MTQVSLTVVFVLSVVATGLVIVCVYLWCKVKDQNMAVARLYSANLDLRKEVHAKSELAAKRWREAMPEFKDGELVIHSATWAPPGHESDPRADVTEILRKLIRNNQLDTRVNIGVLGDPFPRQTKHLKVIWSRARTVDITEQWQNPRGPRVTVARLVLPPPEDERPRASRSILLD